MNPIIKPPWTPEEGARRGAVGSRTGPSSHSRACNRT
jgi:hypothetical protein